jgi:hypothetical protein
MPLKTEHLPKYLSNATFLSGKCDLIWKLTQSTLFCFTKQSRKPLRQSNHRLVSVQSQNRIYLSINDNFFSVQICFVIVRRSKKLPTIIYKVLPLYRIAIYSGRICPKIINIQLVSNKASAYNITRLKQILPKKMGVHIFRAFFFALHEMLRGS